MEFTEDGREIFPEGHISFRKNAIPSLPQEVIVKYFAAQPKISLSPWLTLAPHGSNCVRGQTGLFCHSYFVTHFCIRRLLYEIPRAASVLWITLTFL